MIQCSPASDMVSNQGLARLEAEDSEGVSSEATFHLNEPTIFSKSSLVENSKMSFQQTSSDMCANFDKFYKKK